MLQSTRVWLTRQKLQILCGVHGVSSNNTDDTKGAVVRHYKTNLVVTIFDIRPGGREHVPNPLTGRVTHWKMV